MEKVSIELPVQAWGVIMQRLAKFPFEEVADLIAEIKRQGDANLAALQANPPDLDEE
jgi:hypothetical protein